MKICIYHGPGRFGGDIRAYLYHSRGNAKTGGVLGLVVVEASTTDIVEAAKDGRGASACGTCSHLRDLTCYTMTGHTRIALRNLLANGDDLLPVADVGAATHAMLTLDPVRAVRSAVYGDAAALPVDVWAQVEAAARLVGVPILGYTHGHTALGLDGVDHLRASHVLSIDADTDPAIVAAARARGWRTFRVAAVGEAPQAGEFACPASIERGHVTTCGECLACGTVGNEHGRRSVSIWAHDARNAARARKLLKELGIGRAESPAVQLVAAGQAYASAPAPWAEPLTLEERIRERMPLPSDVGVCHD